MANREVYSQVAYLSTINNKFNLLYHKKIHHSLNMLLEKERREQYSMEFRNVICQFVSQQIPTTA